MYRFQSYYFPGTLLTFDASDKINYVYIIYVIVCSKELRARAFSVSSEFLIARTLSGLERSKL